MLSNAQVSSRSIRGHGVASDLLANRPATDCHHTRVQQQQNCQSRCKLPTPSYPSGKPPSASAAMHMIALPRSASRCRCRRAAAPRHWRSRCPTSPMTGVVEHSKRPALSDATASCLHAARHASLARMNASVAANVHCIAASSKRGLARCHGGSSSLQPLICQMHWRRCLQKSTAQCNPQRRCLRIMSECQGR